MLLGLSPLNWLRSPSPAIDCGILDILTQSQKPGCRAEVLDYFRSATNGDVTSAKQIAVVGDRLFTDIMMANMMGSYGVWVKDGVTEEKSLFTKVETRLAAFLLRRGYHPQNPESEFDS
ncbi:hypothetical protein LTR16_001323 [Cryomyces antarcticus]|uniref:Uncharacterized protein n=1 Tax=Cryomyces antarcticus TaxID=329879 RepID=A0ABR0M8I3_9PEZI|nr:hypothetical protein LTR60_004007 [Cryomyces antarcticus]KAK5294417.1 hypothetical protein LTR16_001323 [Cryomyces antarcticus]